MRPSFLRRVNLLVPCRSPLCYLALQQRHCLSPLPRHTPVPARLPRLPGAAPGSGGRIPGSRLGLRASCQRRSGGLGATGRVQAPPPSHSPRNMHSLCFRCCSSRCISNPGTAAAGDTGQMKSYLYLRFTLPVERPPRHLKVSGLQPADLCRASCTSVVDVSPLSCTDATCRWCMLCAPAGVRFSV